MFLPVASNVLPALVVAVPVAFFFGLVGISARAARPLQGRAKHLAERRAHGSLRPVPRLGGPLRRARRRARARVLRRHPLSEVLTAPGRPRARATTRCAIMAPCSRSETACARPVAARGVDFAQAELATKIRAKYLRALEDERFEQLPSQTYVKGFLRTYADYLGLDGQLYVDEYNSRFVAGDEFDSRPRRSSVRPERRTRRLETSDRPRRRRAGRGRHARRRRAPGRRRARAAKAAGAPARAPSAPTHAGSKPQAYLQIKAVKRPLLRRSSTAAARAASCSSRGRSTRAASSRSPADGKDFWVNISSPENLVIIVGGKARAARRAASRRR